MCLVLVMFSCCVVCISRFVLILDLRCCMCVLMIVFVRLSCLVVVVSELVLIIVMKIVSWFRFMLCRLVIVDCFMEMDNVFVIICFLVMNGECYVGVVCC